MDIMGLLNDLNEYGSVVRRYSKKSEDVDIRLMLGAEYVSHQTIFI